MASSNLTEKRKKNFEILLVQLMQLINIYNLCHLNYFIIYFRTGQELVVDLTDLSTLLTSNLQLLILLFAAAIAIAVCYVSKYDVDARKNCLSFLVSARFLNGTRLFWCSCWSRCLFRQSLGFSQSLSTESWYALELRLLGKFGL